MITIIVLLILAGVALATLTGNTSIIDNANNAVARYNESAGRDQEVINSVENLFEKYIGADNGGEQQEEEQEEPIDYQTLYSNIGLVDYWKLQGSLDNEIEGRDELEANTGTPAINETDVYLNGSVLTTKNNYTLGNNYTVIMQVKDPVFNSSNWNNGSNIMFAIGTAQPNIGSYIIDMQYHYTSTQYGAHSGAGDNYYIGNDFEIPDWNEWHTFAISWDGSSFIFYFDGNYIARSTASSCPNGSKLYIGGAGGTNNVKTTAKYRNVLIFNRALEDYEIENFETIITSNNGIAGTGNIPLYTESQMAKIGSSESVYIKEVKKIYNFDLGKTYILQNNITYHGNYASIQALINSEQVTLDKNGYDITLTPLTYIYNNGTENTAISAQYTGSNGTRTKYSNYLYMEFSDTRSDWHYSTYFGTNNKIDVTNMKKIYVFFSEVNLLNETSIVVSLSSSRGQYVPSDVACERCIKLFGKDILIELNVEDITGTYYLDFGIGSHSPDKPSWNSCVGSGKAKITWVAYE